MSIVRVILSRAITLFPYNHAKASVVSSAKGLVYLESNGDLSQTDKLRTSNGVAEVSGEGPFQILLSNVAKVKRRLPKGKIIAQGLSNQIPYAMSRGGAPTGET